MADIFDTNLQLDSDYTYSTNYPNLVQPPITNVFTGDVNNIVTTINGATGPITFSSPDGFSFSGSTGGNVIFTVSNPATARAALGAAKSGANDDINTFSALTGNTGFNAWTGTPNQASHPTYSGTASVGYVQAELQGVMDSLQQATGLIMALLTALLANGVIET